MNTAISYFIRNYVIEKEAVTVLIPKKLLKLVQVLKVQDWEKYLSDILTDSLSSDIDAEVFGDPEEVIKDFGLKEEFQFYHGH